MMFKSTLMVFLGMLLAAGCAGGGDGGGDGGADGATDAADGLDGAEGDTLPADLDPGAGFGLLVPAGTRVCTYSSDSDPLEAYRKAARVTLRGDFVKFSRELGQLEYDFIEKIEFGPERLVLAPKGAGAFSRSLQGTAQEGTYIYKFEQKFDAGGRDLSVSFSFRYKVSGGRAEKPVMVLDAAALGIDPWNADRDKTGFELTALYDDPQSPYGRDRRFAACELGALDRTQIDIALTSGDQLRFSVRCPDHSLVFVILSTVCPCLLESASFARGAETREVGDFFHLAFVSWNHCNLTQEMLAVFDRPLAGIYGVRVPGGPDSKQMATVPTEVIFLDAELKQKESVKITGWTVR